MDVKFVQRADKVTFMKVEGNEYHRMKGFSALTTEFNPQEYSRQYVDEAFETTDVVAISRSVEFEMDQRKNDPVHEQIVDIIENEKLGDDAVVTLLSVDFTEEIGDGYKAVKRDFTVIPESAGDGTEFYKYTGTFRVKGEPVEGYATSEDDFKETCTFVEEMPDNGVEG